MGLASGLPLASSEGPHRRVIALPAVIIGETGTGTELVAADEGAPGLYTALFGHPSRSRKKQAKDDSQQAGDKVAEKSGDQAADKAATPAASSPGEHAT